MEHNDYLLESFSSSMIQYLNEVLIHKNCVSHSFRKYSVKNGKDVEFSFLLKSVINSSSGDKNSLNKNNSTCIAEEELTRIILVSQSWCLHLAEVFIKESKLCLKLNQPHAFLSVIKTILSQKSNYGKKFSADQMIKLTRDELDDTDLTTHRLKVASKASENCLRAAGYRLSESKGVKWVHLTTKTKDKGGENEPKYIVCGAILNMETGSKETRISTEEYYRLRRDDLEILSGQKQSGNRDENFIESLTDASLKLSLLEVKVNQATCLNFNSNFTRQRETRSKGAIFVLYNISRLANIRKNYFQRMNDKIYPLVPEADEVDFGSLTEPEEWSLLFNFLLEYPSLIVRCAENIANGRPAIHHICNFLFRICSLFSVYYRRIRILLEPKGHLIALLHARLLLAMSVEQILENGLDLLDIKRVDEM